MEWALIAPFLPAPIRNAYIKRGMPQLHGNVERSHSSDGQECYQLLRYKGDVDLEA